MAIALIAIMCTFAAGCISEEKTDGNVDEQNAKKKFEYYMDIVNTQPDKTFKDPGSYNVMYYGGIEAFVCSSKTISVDNGVMLDAKLDTDIFLINDADASITSDGLAVFDDNENLIAYIIYAKPNQYELFLTNLEKELEESEKKAKEKLEYYKDVATAQPERVQNVVGAFSMLDEKFCSESLYSPKTVNVDNGVMLDSSNGSMDLFIIKNTHISSSNVDIVMPEQHKKAWIIYVTPEQYDQFFVILKDAFKKMTKYEEF